MRVIKQQPTHSTGDLIMALGNTLRRWASYRKTVRALNQLDERGLNDLGINRGDIAAVARSQAERI
ncbi:MAG: hypothetical protein ACJAZW_002358 [Maritalea sp.]|jgi:uncharacterized protein YjiS (DUF1127 family)